MISELNLEKEYLERQISYATANCNRISKEKDINKNYPIIIWTICLIAINGSSEGIEIKQSLITSISHLINRALNQKSLKNKFREFLVCGKNMINVVKI